jgi:hypothetical protein
VQQAGGTPEQIADHLDAHLVGDSGDGDGDGLPGHGVVQAHLFGGGSGITGPAAALAGLAIGGQKVQLGIFADAPHKNSIRGKHLQDRGIGIAAIAEQKEGTRGTLGFGIQRLAQRGNLLRRQEGDTGQAAGRALR